jgi:dimethylhistidine N-methyltransferase
MLSRNVEFTDLHPRTSDTRQEILTGLEQQPRSINPKYFYDEQGSRLFEAITELDEYYPTRTEIGILSDNAAAIAAACGADSVLVEPGSGNCEKVRYLLDAMKPHTYVPMDISSSFLRQAADQLGSDFPWLQVHAVCADFNTRWQDMPKLPTGRRIIFYPGSTIGNLEPDDACAFLAHLGQWMGDDGGAIVGVDLHKSHARLEAAYNDSQGVTAAFNRNMLSHVNRLLDAQFNVELFRHHAVYNSDRRRIEMHLVSEKDQSVRCNGSVLKFHEGETIHTEYSYKYSVDDFASLAQRAGLTLSQSWLDKDKLFSVHYLQKSPVSPQGF